LDILERPWFTRVWVFQELLLSRDPWLQCGYQRIRWGELHNLFRRKKNKWESYTVKPQQGALFSQFLGMSASRQDILSRDHTATTVQAAEYFKTLVRTLQKRRGLGVQGPREMVFSHLGIAGTINESDHSAICRGNDCRL
jgi:hypothetical protein